MSESTNTLEYDHSQQQHIDSPPSQLLDLDTEETLQTPTPVSSEPKGVVKDDNTTSPTLTMDPMPLAESESDDTFVKQQDTSPSPNDPLPQDDNDERTSQEFVNPNHLPPSSSIENTNHQEHGNLNDDDFDWGESALNTIPESTDKQQDIDETNDDFDDFDDPNDNDDGDDDDDDFGDFGDFDDQQGGGDGDDFDDFGDFGDLPDEEFSEAVQHEELALETPASSEPTVLDQYIELLEAGESDLTSFMETTLSELWTPLDDTTTFVASPTSFGSSLTDNELLCTECSLDLWQKLSRDSVFYNPITGSIGQFQWTRSEINRAYLNALGVRINYEDRLQETRPTSMTSSPQSRPPSSSPPSSYSKPSPSNHMRSNSLSNGMSLAGGAAAMAALHGGLITGTTKPVEEEPELDIDIAKAYCELTEETIRVFPDVKLNAMVVELSRLQRQAKEYLSYLLDQREQLMMDAETYNDLISCIVGHAQRLKEQTATKDASPAMVSKKKKTGGISGMIKRKNTTGSGTSMGGGVVGVKQANVKNPAEGRRSM